jgi:hypothetical protein
MKSVDVAAALRSAGASAQVRVRLLGEAAGRFHSLLRSTGLSAEAAASELLSAVLLEHPEIPGLITKTGDDSGRGSDLRCMTIAQLRTSYRKHLIAKESLEAFLVELLKKYSGRLGLVATNAFHLKDGPAKKSFYAWVRFLRTAHGFRLPVDRQFAGARSR